MERQRKTSLGLLNQDVSVGGRFGAEYAREQDDAAAVAALTEMMKRRGLALIIDDETFDFPSLEFSAETLEEIVRRLTAFQLGYPTSLRLSAIAEAIQLRTAVLALDR